jgi:hypothetical protein
MPATTVRRGPKTDDPAKASPTAKPRFNKLRTVATAPQIVEKPKRAKPPVKRTAPSRNASQPAANGNKPAKPRP